MPTGYEVQMYRDLQAIAKALRVLSSDLGLGELKAAVDGIHEVNANLTQLNDRLDTHTRMTEQGMTDLHLELVEVKNAVRSYGN